jgi:hypothetical protein
VVSDLEVNRRLRSFVCVRMDWDQMEKHRGKLPIPTQGDQVLLDPQGKPIPGIEPRGKRYDIPTFIGLLDRVLKEYPADPKQKDNLKLSWFFWNPRDQGLPGHFDAEAISRLDRKPVLTVSGSGIPTWMDSPAFLRKHLRQFIWTRGPSEGEPRLSVRQIEPQPKELASFSLAPIRPEQVSRILDRAWLDYMKERPIVARGYIDNPHGRWLKSVMERAYQEELMVREQAMAGTLKPPGR